MGTIFLLTCPATCLLEGGHATVCSSSKAAHRRVKISHTACQRVWQQVGSKISRTVLPNADNIQHTCNYVTIPSHKLHTHTHTSQFTHTHNPPPNYATLTYTSPNLHTNTHMSCTDTDMCWDKTRSALAQFQDTCCLRSPRQYGGCDIPLHACGIPHHNPVSTAMQRSRCTQRNQTF